MIGIAWTAIYTQFSHWTTHINFLPRLMRFGFASGSKILSAFILVKRSAFACWCTHMSIVMRFHHFTKDVSLDAVCKQPSRKHWWDILSYLVSLIPSMSVIVFSLSCLLCWICHLQVCNGAIHSCTWCKHRCPKSSLYGISPDAPSSASQTAVSHDWDHRVYAPI